MKNKFFPNLASPITINGVTFKNRILGAPMSNPELDPDCHMRKEEIAFHENRARGGMASVAIGLGIVDPDGRTHTKEAKLYDVMSLPSLKEVTNAIHRHNCRAVMELAHGGKYAGARSHGDPHIPTVYGPNDEINPEGLAVTRMTEEDIYRIAGLFGEAAALCKKAGFDMVLIHGGHGWLLAQFMSPLMNRRTDRWGGSLENRMRFPLLVIEKVARGRRPAVPHRIPHERRRTGQGRVWTRRGRGDGKDDRRQGRHHPCLRRRARGPGGVRRDASVHVHRARLQRLSGRGDQKARENAGRHTWRTERSGDDGGDHRLRQGGYRGVGAAVDLRPVFPGEGVLGPCGRHHPLLPLLHLLLQLSDEPHVLLCVQSRRRARTGELSAPPATTPKKVVVVGGGPGGMEAAIVAAQRGHSVTLYEKSGRLGGQLCSEQYIPFKQDMYNFVKVLEGRLQKAGVDVRLNTALTPEQAEALGADVVIVAVGAQPIVPPIPGIDGKNVVGLEALHQPEPALGQKVVILGGGLVGTECAIYLDGLGKDVTVLEMKDDWAADAYFMHRNAMKIYIDGSRIQIRTRTTAKAITEQGVLCAGPDGEVLVEADTILLAAGMKPDRAAVDAFYNTAPRVFQVGDCIQTGRVVDAVGMGYSIALDI